MQIILREDGDDQNTGDTFDDDIWNPYHKIHQQLLSFWKNPISLASFLLVFIVLFAATHLGNIILLLLLSAGPNQH